MLMICKIFASLLTSFPARAESQHFHQVSFIIGDQNFMRPGDIFSTHLNPFSFPNSSSRKGRIAKISVPGSAEIREESTG